MTGERDKNSSALIAPARLSGDARTGWLLSAFRERLDHLTGTRPAGGPAAREVLRLRPYFRALDGIANQTAGQKIDSQRLFEMLLDRKRSLWTGVFQAMESVFPLGDPRFTHGHIEGIELAGRDEDGVETGLKFGSVKRFRGADGYEMFQCLVSVPFEDQGRKLTGRYPVVMFDRRICRALQDMPELQVRGMPRILMLAATVMTLASHDWVHGTAVPWRDDAARPMPDEFRDWQHEILSGPPLLLAEAAKNPHIGWPMNYEIMSQRVAYETMGKMRQEGLKGIVSAFLREAALFRGKSADEDAAKMALHLVRNVARFAAHVMPYETLEPLLASHGYKFARTKFCRAVQENPQIPLAVSNDPPVPYVYSINEVADRFDAAAVTDDLQCGGWKLRVAGQRAAKGAPVADPQTVGTVADIVSGFYRRATGQPGPG